MKKTSLKRISLDLGSVKGGVVPVVLGKSTFDASVGSSAGDPSRSASELGLTTVEQQ